MAEVPEILSTSEVVQLEYNMISFYMVIGLAMQVRSCTRHCAITGARGRLCDLVHDQLTPRLVDADTLTSALGAIVRVLRGRAKERCVSTAKKEIC
jgi:hypothetical protein